MALVQDGILDAWNRDIPFKLMTSLMVAAHAVVNVVGQLVEGRLGDWRGKMMVKVIAGIGKEGDVDGGVWFRCAVLLCKCKCEAVNNAGAPGGQIAHGPKAPQPISSLPRPWFFRPDQLNIRPNQSMCERSRSVRHQ